MEGNRQNYIECISLSKYYNGKGNIIRAVDEVDLSVGRNQLAIIKGRSGAGKSTLLNLMCGLVRPTGGKVIIDGDCISDMTDGPLSRILSERIGIIFQSFNLLPTYTVYENIEIAMVPKGIGQAGSMDTIHNMLVQFGLKGKESMMPSELSEGQQQKVAIIRSLIKQPSVIFADEPTGSVDSETAAEILDHLVDMKNSKKVTVVIATHGNISETIADKVFVIENGRLLV